MGIRDEPEKKSSGKAPRWAERLAVRRQHIHDATPASEIGEEDWTGDAIAALWSQFDEAVEQATGALERSGAADRIMTQRSNREYRLSMPGPVGEQRQIAVFASLRLVEGHPSGGAHVTTSLTRATMHLAPSHQHGHPRWTIQATETPFSAAIVGDLFLSVFSDDPAATERLSAHFTPTP